MLEDMLLVKFELGAEGFDDERELCSGGSHDSLG